MGKALQAVIMGMYLPIIILSGAACFLYITKILIPAFRGGYFNFEKHAVALAAITALLAHFSENVYYGVGRVNGPLFDWMTNQWAMVGAMKMLILVSSILATSVYNKSRFGISNIGKLICLVIVLWSSTSIGLWIFADLQHV